MTKLQGAWLAGLLEGEGCFIPGPPSCPHRPIVQLAMTDEDVVRKAAALMGIKSIHCKRDPRNSNWKDYYAARLKGRRAVLLMKVLLPLMGKRRRVQIIKAIASYKNKRVVKLTPSSVRKIRQATAKRNPNISHLAERFKVSRFTIRQVRDRNIHAGVV